MTAPAIQGYPREDGVFGIRNHVLVISSVSCANYLVEQVGRAEPDVVTVTHQHGCTHLGDDREQVLRTLAGTCGNPNVGAVLIVGLGCESTSAADIAELVPTENRMVRTLVIQDVGNAEKLFRQAMGHIAEMKQFVAAQKAVQCGISALTVGLECGGSDPFSGITANPMVGLVSDRLVDAGATVILSEVPEMIGTQDALAPRIPDENVRADLFGRIDRYIQAAMDQGCDLIGVNPTPGNIRAGLSSIEEKSLGCICKGGSSDIVEVLDYAQAPSKKGLVVMDTPGNDPESITGMVAGGATLVLFTTGVGTPLGNPVAPVVKISSNTAMYERMADFIDVDAGQIIDGRPMDALAEATFGFLVGVCNGTLTAAEKHGCHEFAVNRIGVTF
ncbi:MAG: UxaA family hydrolase [Phycisphaerae bacterium]